MKYKLKPLEKASILPKNLDYVQLTSSDYLKNLIIILADSDDNEYMLTFERESAFQVVDESDRISIWKDYNELKSDAPIVIVEDSLYLKQALPYAHEIGITGLVHYFIAAENSCIDVICGTEPKIVKL